MTLLPADPYERLALIYDHMMAHVDYAMWAEYVRALWERHQGGEPTDCFDAACGTGRFLAELGAPGLRMGGADASSAMLEKARRRLPRRARLSCQDLRELRDGGQWALVTCLYDSLNYLTESRDLARALEHLAALCEAGGLVIFDICTERNSLEHFKDRTEHGRADGWSWERHSWYDKDARLHHNEFLVEHAASGRRFVEVHRQRIYAVDEVADLATAAGLEVLARYAEFGMKPGDERADRVHFVTRRRGEGA